MGEAEGGYKTCPTLGFLITLSRVGSLSVAYPLSVSLKTHEATWWEEIRSFQGLFCVSSEVLAAWKLQEMTHRKAFWFHFWSRRPPAEVAGKTRGAQWRSSEHKSTSGGHGCSREGNLDCGRAEGRSSEHAPLTTVTVQPHQITTGELASWIRHLGFFSLLFISLLFSTLINKSHPKVFKTIRWIDSSALNFHLKFNFHLSF